MSVAEPTLQDLAAKFADSDDDVAEIREGNGAQSAEIPKPSAAQVNQESGPQADYDDDDEWNDDGDDWDSNDEAELASALEWADLREGMLIGVYIQVPPYVFWFHFSASSSSCTIP